MGSTQPTWSKPAVVRALAEVGTSLRCRLSSAAIDEDAPVGRGRDHHGCGDPCSVFLARR